MITNIAYGKVVNIPFPFNPFDGLLQQKHTIVLEIFTLIFKTVALLLLALEQELEGKDFEQKGTFDLVRVNNVLASSRVG